MSLLKSITKSFITIFVSAFFLVEGYAQLPSPNVSSLSPKASAIMRANNIPVGYHTGTISPNIDLFTVKAKDIKIPINLSYNSLGVKVETNYSSVGTNWELNVGGLIARNIRGQENLKRLALDDVLVPQNANEENFWNIAGFAHNNYDGEGDLFHYNVNGYTGTFFFDDIGVVLQQHDPQVRMTFDGSSVSGTFTMLDESGNSYFLKAMDSYYNFTNWYLEKITSRDGTIVVTFDYIDAGRSVMAPRNSKRYSFSHTNPVGNPLYTPANMYSTQLHDRLVRKINVSTGDSVVFDYGTFGYLEGPDLKNIKYFSGGEIVKWIDFQVNKVQTLHPYQMPSLDYPEVSHNPQLNYRLYLDRVVLRGTGSSDSLVYAMEYMGRSPNGKDSLPSKLSCAQDYYGYYNGKNGNTTLIPTIYENLDPFLGNLPSFSHLDETFPIVPIQVPGADRRPDESFRKYGSLRSIIYPTGGRDVFEFESHKDPYGHGISDGLRIKSIQSYSTASAIPLIRRFSYDEPVLGYNDFPMYAFLFYDNAMPQGIHYFIWEFPMVGDPIRYGIGIELFPGLRDDVSLNQVPKISYRKVTEFRGNGINGGYTVYTYHAETGYIEHFDNNRMRAIVLGSTGVIANQEAIYGRFGWPLGPYSTHDLWKNGNLLTKKVYNSASQEVESEERFYKYQILKEVPSIKVLTLDSDLAYMFYNYKQLSTYTQLDSIISIRDGIREKKSFEYTTQPIGNLRREYVKSSSGGDYSVEYNYAFDRLGSVYQKLSASNYLSPVEINRYSNALLINRELANFSLFEQIPRLQNVQNYNNGTILSSNINYLKYDSFGNPLEIQQEGDVVRSYLWANRGKYLIGDIKNASYSDVVATLGSTAINNLSLPTVSDGTINSVIGLLRNDRNFKKSQINSYTYQPLVGMTSQTDPRGVTEFYEYDSFGRLSAVKDFEGNIIKTYCYNYAGQQVECPQLNGFNKGTLF